MHNCHSQEHKHPLLRQFEWTPKNCSRCGKHTDSYFECFQCPTFSLCNRCFFPSQKQGSIRFHFPHHPHSLSLMVPPGDNGYSCAICGGSFGFLSYHCDRCSYNVCGNCFKLNGRRTRLPITSSYNFDHHGNEGKSQKNASIYDVMERIVRNENENKRRRELLIERARGTRNSAITTNTNTNTTLNYQSEQERKKANLGNVNHTNKCNQLQVELELLLQEMGVDSLRDLFQTASQLVQEHEEKKRQSLCCLCMEGQKIAVAVPCGHKLCCNDCHSNPQTYSQITTCPLCRCEITSMLRVYD